MLMKLLGVCCAIAATSTVLVYGLGLQVQRPIVPLEATQEAPRTTPKAPAVVASAPVHAPAGLELELELELETELETEADLVGQSDLVVTEQPVLEQASVANEITLEVEPEGEALLAVEATTEQVFVFWQPFRSRGSAQGFAQGLSARADVPVSVISEQTDAGRHYRVVLPYDSEAQRLERLAKLESATRLEMGE